MPGHGINAYRKIQLESASPPRILLELYRRLEADLRLGRACIAAGDAAGKGQALGHALAILGQLQEALDHAVAPELCRDLSDSYTFCSGRILQASLKMETGPLDEVVRVISPIHQAYEEVIAPPPAPPTKAP